MAGGSTGASTAADAASDGGGGPIDAGRPEPSARNRGLCPKTGRMSATARNRSLRDWPLLDTCASALYGQANGDRVELKMGGVEPQ
jgi:hypothetical protein